MFTEKIRVALTELSVGAAGRIMDHLRGEEGIRLVGLYGTVEEAQDGLNGTHTDVLIIGLDHVADDLGEQIKNLEYYHPTLTLILTGPVDKVIDFHHINHATRGCMPESFLKESLIEAIQTIHRGADYMHPLFQQRLDETHGANNVDTDQPQLTEIEMQILDLFSEEYSSREVALELSMTNESIVDHRDQLMTKLNAKSIGDMVRTASEKGLL